MAKFIDSKFINSTVVLDGNEYIGCEFTNSRIVITRGNFTLKDSNFDSCAFEFAGEAANIKSLVEGLLNQSTPTSKPSTTSDLGAQNDV